MTLIAFQDNPVTLSCPFFCPIFTLCDTELSNMYQESLRGVEHLPEH
ncbi:hypothetical protein L1D34_23120 [Vibrio mediterranei]|nr:hypothetical protein [Vibrio mediterranei]MCG9627728.1 hypothetical protein [Vibrio mediterranei]